MTIQNVNLPATTSKETIEVYTKLLDILRYLRSEEGCPWDQEQTVESLRNEIIEETSELLDAIANNIDYPSEESRALLEEEMGDVVLDITMMMLVYEDHYDTPIHTILDQINQKLIRRHPHVFGDSQVENPEQLLTQWNKIKKEQEGKVTPTLDEYKNYMHILERCRNVQKRLAKENKGFNAPLKDKIQNLEAQVQAMQSLTTQIPSGNYTPAPEQIEKDLGEAMFTLIDIMREFKVNPTASLTRVLNSVINSQE